MKDETQFVIITGLSGAGKTQATRCFEDLGFFCIDNLPPSLIPQFAGLCQESGGKIRKVALVIDIRGGDFFNTLFSSLKGLKARGINYQILFLEASVESLVRRFKETRRKHPLSMEGSVLEGIKSEKKRLREVRAKADQIVDTTELTPWDLKRKIASTFLPGEEGEIIITVISFGYKYGIPMDADLVFDVRFLPNPNYVDEFHFLTGMNKPAREFVLNSPITKDFLKRLFDLLEFLIPYNIKEGKGYLTIAIGCTGGRHRSVVVSNELGKYLKKKYKANVQHRDVKKR